MNIENSKYATCLFQDLERSIFVERKDIGFTEYASSGELGKEICNRIINQTTQGKIHPCLKFYLHGVKTSIIEAVIYMFFTDEEIFLQEDCVKTLGFLARYTTDKSITESLLADALMNVFVDFYEEIAEHAWFLKMWTDLLRRSINLLPGVKQRVFEHFQDRNSDFANLKPVYYAFKTDDKCNQHNLNHTLQNILQHVKYVLV
jgi:hypothetical protein